MLITIAVLDFAVGLACVLLGSFKWMARKNRPASLLMCFTGLMIIGFGIVLLTNNY